MDFTFWSHPTPFGITVEEVFGDGKPNEKLWLEMAYQIFCEHGADGSYREIKHFDNGVPYIKGLNQRISITHTKGFLAVAFLPPVSDADLVSFNPKTALGIDAEHLDRSKVLKVREKFLSPDELKLIPEDDIKANILAWTIKEAVLKASMNSAIDYRNNIVINTLPHLYKSCEEALSASSPLIGSATLLPSTSSTPNLSSSNPDSSVSHLPLSFRHFSYESEGNCVTLAFT